MHKILTKATKKAIQNLTLIICTTSWGYGLLFYEFHKETRLNKMTLHELELHRAEIQIATGHTTENPFLADKAYQSLRSKSKAIPRKHIKKAQTHKYLHKLEQRIQNSRKSKQDFLLKGLERSLQKGQKPAEIHMSTIADLDLDTHYELITIIRRSYPKVRTKYQNDTYKHYYTKAHRLSLGVFDGKSFQEVTLSNQAYGRAEYINDFRINYKTGAPQAQIQIILHSFDLSQNEDSEHKQQFLLFLYNKGYLKRTLLFEPYYSIISRKHEDQVTEHKIHTKDITGDKKEELIFHGATKKITFSKAVSVSRSHTSKTLKEWIIHLEYDSKKHNYKPISRKKDT